MFDYLSWQQKSMYSLLSYFSLAICLGVLAYPDEITAQLTEYFLTAMSEFPCNIIL